MILIVTNTQDVTADFVVREITRRGLSFARLNTDEFPVNACASIAIQTAQAARATLTWTNRDRVLNWSEVSAIWYRRPITPSIASEVTDPGVRKFAADEAYDFLRGMWYSLDCFWMSHPDAIRRAEHKIVQLQTACRLGFAIPRTVVTNSPDEVRKLHNLCPNGIVAKPLYLGFLEEGGEGKLIYTSRVSLSDLADSDAIRFSPSIYQEYIPKSADLRVTVVGNQVFAAKIVANSLPDRTPDWRYADESELQHYKYDLPPQEEARCIQLVQSLGLEFGAIDYALDKAGKHVFLEINPNGQWAWLESAVDANISGAIVDRLVASGSKRMHPL